MDKQGWFIDRTKFASPPYHHDAMAVYDATNPAARKYYWQLMNEHLFSIGVDAWWLDTTEPETENQEENILLGHKLYIGSGDRYANIYPLMTTTAVYDGQRATSDQKRVFILSRSAYAGAQRNAVTAWSGDVLENWETFKRQIPAGLNYSLSGMPYWTTDIGGFISGGNLDDPRYRELFVRWFEYGAFCPIFRTHGTRNPDTNELWSYGPENEKILVQYDRLRYRLMPYTYSLAWSVTNASYTPMRPLAMDFREDVTAQNIGDEFMYGPAFLVAPVTEQGATDRRVYLPNTHWYDFWTGQPVEGGRTFSAAAPIDRMPLYVRAGAIVPFGPDEQYASEKQDPIEVRVYRGANGSFDLYEDEGDNYNYEKGAHSSIPMNWNEQRHTLTIGERKGQFAGMPRSHTFRIVFVGAQHGAGVDSVQQADKIVTYNGCGMTVVAQ
jgi:alpha-D-xyloside xylohydrolase